MTWVKTGTEFPDDAADAGLSDAAYRTHHEALTWLYRVERDDMRVPKHLVRRFAGSSDYGPATEELVATGFWSDDGTSWVVEHHAEVLRQSLAAQVKHRAQERERQARKRAAAAAKADRDAANVDSNPESNVGTNVAETLSVRHSPHVGGYASKALDETEDAHAHAREDFCVCGAALWYPDSKRDGVCGSCRKEGAA